MKINHNLPIDPMDTHGQPPASRHFPFLDETDIVLSTTKNYIAEKSIDKMTFIEIKCTSDNEWDFYIAHKSRKFWIALQLLGESHPANAPECKIEHQQYLAFYNAANKLKLVIQRGKTALLLIGIKINDIATFGMEWKSLQVAQETKFKRYIKINMGYRVKNILTQIQSTKSTHFSLAYKLSPLIIQLIDTYHAGLIERSKFGKEADVSLLHRAKQYILAHYRDENISINQMVSELRTSRRTLFRIFKDNGLTVNSAIQSIRIYKGREMLQRSNESVDMIAFHLQYATAKYFIKQYVKYFGHTPAAERELLKKRKSPAKNKKSAEIKLKPVIEKNNWLKK